jgi:hypothetical protein
MVPRVVAKVERHPGEPYPRVGFIVINLARPTERVFTFQMAKVAVLRALFANIPRRVDRPEPMLSWA